jgi:hypothetical protein
MAVQVGTYDIATLLAVRTTSANAYGLDTIAAILQADLDAWNRQSMEAMSFLADTSTDVQRIYGASIGGEMVKVDEYARSATQKGQTGSTVGFPLDKFQFGIGWTGEFMKRATPADLAATQKAAQTAYARSIVREIKRALYLSANYTFKDYLVNGVDVPVKRLVNADSAAIPNGPDGGTFTASSHTHYDANATLTATVALAAITDVVEHGFGGRIIQAYNFNDEATVRALTGFVPAPDYRVVPATTAAYTQQTTNYADQYNKFIGILGAAEVWIKPWAIQNYAFTWDVDSPQKPLVMRQDAVAGFQGLRIAAELDTYPLYAKYYEAAYGFGVWSRTNGHVLYFASGSYADPTIS